MRRIDDVLRHGAHAIFSPQGEVKIPRSYEEAMASPEKEQWEAAVIAELESLMKHGTWRLEKLPDGRKAIGCKWVFALKKDKAGNIIRFKARLVTKG